MCLPERLGLMLLIGRLFMSRGDVGWRWITLDSIVVLRFICGFWGR